LFITKRYTKQNTSLATYVNRV